VGCGESVKFGGPTDERVVWRMSVTARHELTAVYVAITRHNQCPLMAAYYLYSLGSEMSCVQLLKYGPQISHVKIARVLPMGFDTRAPYAAILA